MSTNCHVLSVDVEDYHNGILLYATGRLVPPTDAVVRYTRELLSMFESRGHKATWFFLGEVAERFPFLVREIVDLGHEPAVHGFHHYRIHELSPEAYRESILRAKQVLEDISGREVLGYRAVAASVSRATWYAYDVLIDAGFRYSSSIFPYGGPIYGIADAQVEPHWVDAPSKGQIFEIPFSVAKLGRLRLPCAGGGYLRHLPLFYTKATIKLLEHDGRRAMVYLHPYEIEPPGVDLNVSLSLRERLLLWKHGLTQYRGRKRQRSKLEYLLKRLRFDTVENLYRTEIMGGPSPLRSKASSTATSPSPS